MINLDHFLVLSSPVYQGIDQWIHHHSFSSSQISSWLGAPFIPDPNRFSRISKILSAMSRSSYFLANTHFSAVPSRLLSISVHACFSSFKLSCLRCSLITSNQVSMQPSESSSNSFGFLKDFLDLPPPLSLDSFFLVANASNVLFIISQVFAHVMASGVTLVWASDFLGILVEFDSRPVAAVPVILDHMLFVIRGNGVDSCFLC